jgi:hypothetical protein
VHRRGPELLSVSITTLRQEALLDNLHFSLKTLAVASNETPQQAFFAFSACCGVRQSALKGTISV